MEVGAAPPLDILPILKHVPACFAQWKRKAQENRVELKRIYVDVCKLQGQLQWICCRPDISLPVYKELKLKMAKGIYSGCWMEESELFVVSRNFVLL